uniref:hypothetical protein n=1 Tax=Altererythrobacter segetis TaxID=1104773 RepID=UPI0014093494|nr:hypothetical protein [Altererythrobacter segetis]
MIGYAIILFFFALLTVGQGRVTLRDLRTGRAGWGDAQYEKDSNRTGYWTMTVIDAALFGYLCFAWINGGIELLR